MKPSYILDQLWRLFSSVKLAIWIFIALAVSTMAGSIVLQRPIAEPGQLERVYSPDVIRWLDYFDLLDVFHSWWFVLELALLALTVTVVSIDMWPRFRKRIESFKPILSDSGLPPYHATFQHHQPVKAISEKLQKFVQKRFRKPIITESDGKINIAAESARFSHLGVYVIHTGIVLILIGGLIGARKGFEGQVALAPGEQSDHYFDRKEPGKKIPLGFEVRCLDARMEKYPDNSPKAYFSDLEIYDHNQLMAKKTIKVNDPLSYKNIYFYQATFGQRAADEKTTISLDVIDNVSKKQMSFVSDFDKLEKLPNGKGTFKIVDYAENIPLDVEGHARNLGEAVKVALSEQGEPANEVWIFKEFPNFDRDVRKGKYQLVFKDFKYDYHVVNVTGLQVAKNPGINITWIGSALLLSGLLATFWIPHRKLWIVISDKEVVVAAASHRHPGTFARKVKRMINEIRNEILGDISKDSDNNSLVVWSPRFSGEQNDTFAF